MSELTVTILRLGLLALLWFFVLSVAGVLRGDLYGTRVLERQSGARRRGGLFSRGGGRRGRREGSSRSPLRPRRTDPDTPPPLPPQRNPRTPTHLVLTTGPLAGTTLPLRDSGVLVGRNPECSLVLDDDYASGRHARILRGEDGWYVEDLGSTNGTFIGQYRVGEAVPVETGTTIRIGKTHIELRN